MLQLLLALRSGRHPNANELAAFCEVSRRTIYRDLEALMRAGVTVRYRADRQGYELGSGVFLDPPRLAEEEAAALVIRAYAGGRDWPSLPHKAEAAALKCAHGLSEEARRRVLGLAELLGGPPAGRGPGPECVAASRVLLQGLLERRQVRLWYREPGSGEDLGTKFAAYRVDLDGDAWSLVGRSSYHRELIGLRLDWIRRAELTDDTYTLPPRARLLRPRRRSGGRLVRVRYRGSAGPPGAARLPGEVVERRRAEDGSLELVLRTAGVARLRAWLLGQGGRAEVVSPPELRLEVHRLALEIARRHAEAPDGRPESRDVDVPRLREPASRGTAAVPG